MNNIEQQTLAPETSGQPAPPQEITGSQAVLEALIAEGVDTIFGIPGGAILPIYDTLYDYREQLTHVLVRHEQGGAHAAQGYARASGKVGVVFATSGPGATNILTGVADAQMDSTPLVCITGQVYSHLLGTDAFQETDVVNITASVSKWNYLVTDASEIPVILAKAFFIARTGRPGPVLIDITKDAQLQKFPYEGYKKMTAIRSYKPRPTVKPEAIRAAAELINNAEKPMILWGQGVILGNAEEEFKAFVEKSGIPAAWTLLGAGAIPTNHPLNVGMLGMHGNYAPNVLTNECDVLIAIGMRFDDRVTGRLDKYARQARVVHLDIDRAEIGKNVKTEVAICGNCKETIPLLTEMIVGKSHTKWLAMFRALYGEELETVIYPEMAPVDGGITMGEVIHQLNVLTGGEAIVVTDVGQNQMVTCRYVKLNNSRSSITSGGLGTMGFALPAAIGAKFGAPHRDVIAVAGDGGFQMTLQELGTIMQTRLNLKIIILNNQYLGMVRQWQELFSDSRYSFVDIESPDFVNLAASYHINGKRISKREEIRGALTEMLAHDGAFLLEVMVIKENNVFPMIPQGAGISEIRLR
ncbi:acetolactate synthase, large subunit [Dyadobacter sp. SG02]|uniref:biosynthetic-type acetolactate synthase large subunit n=1 Tax=Dyadobacter sp. SG02 TaxID=1855291 RepID=UPI0008D4384C|nr:biosynthetic-type acetolactate synthase large subunit [Dyadobacter sp. SG02]SEJ40208.1 acetolactate synthase, large subunit [Dyadobacter sp. SG02]